MFSEIVLTRKILKYRIKGVKNVLYEHDSERKQVLDLLLRTAETGESNSALLIGPRNCGKTTLIKSVLKSVKSESSFTKNTIIVDLNGFIHTDDNIALQSITTQLSLDNAIDGKVFGSFAETLWFLLECLKSGNKNQSKSIIFIIEEFDLFCSHHNQTLLYNLFDVSQSAQAPICVLGITCRLDVIELLEKRVKSRFSHRQFFMLCKYNFNERLDLVKNLLQLNEITDSKNDFKNCKLSKKWIEYWNNNITQLLDNKKVKSVLERFFSYEINVGSLKSLLYGIIIKLNDEHFLITIADITETISAFENDSKILLLCDLSVLEICLIITIKHHCEIYDRDPFNFEMIFSRFNKFANTSRIFQNLNRDVVMKSFERIQQLEFISTVSTNNLLKQFQMFRLLLSFTEIKQAISKYHDLPTDIEQWSKCSLF